MNYRILERLRSVIAEKKVTQRGLAKGMEMSVTTVNKFLNYEDELSIFMINKFSEVLGLNPSWVLKGTGPKVLKEGQKVEEVDDSSLWEEFEELKQRNLRLEEENEKLKNSTNIPLASEEETSIVLLDTKAVLKYPANLSNPEFFKPMPVFKFPASRFPMKVYRAFEVIGDEMNHTVIEGDLAFCVKVEDLSLIKDAYIYIIVLEKEVICRRVLNRIKGRGRLRLKCDNKYFRDKEIEADKVKEIWEVKSTHRFTLGNPYFEMQDWVKKLEDKVYEMEERLDKAGA
jgi:transcriptional regulator with XRE-family HTH domain